ncbi:MAG TPA: PCRF domain-containing protein, partial [Terriglobia bacterium]|nr:PCRF domain-containing protein [Terriglobia bacterium]
MEAIETQITRPDFWEDPQNSQTLLTQRKRLESGIQSDEHLASKLADLEAYFELAGEGESVLQEIRAEINALRAEVDQLETTTLLPSENDRLNAIVTVHPGAGGTESQDWAEMLLRMYRRWAERHNFKFTLNDYQSGEEAGLKSATFTVAGDYSYGLLSAESGVHR